MKSLEKGLREMNVRSHRNQGVLAKAINFFSKFKIQKIPQNQRLRDWTS